MAACRSLDAYELLSRVGKGAYGVVFRARDRETGEVVALKKVERNIMTIREIGILASLRHQPRIVRFKGIVFDSEGCASDNIFVAMEYMEHNLKQVIDAVEKPFSEGEVKYLMLLLLQGIEGVHRNGVLHRDLKPSNLLLNLRGELKLCDFGLSCRCGIGGVRQEQPFAYWVVTLWYRAPELLLKAKGYSAAIDMWSIGCIMAELLSKAPLFPGYDLLRGLLRYDPNKRMTVEQALNHKWFREFPLPSKLRLFGGHIL